MLLKVSPFGLKRRPLWQLYRWEIGIAELECFTKSVGSNGKQPCGYKLERLKPSKPVQALTKILDSAPPDFSTCVRLQFERQLQGMGPHDG